jgi:nitrogen fixation NifU-like protein
MIAELYHQDMVERARRGFGKGRLQQASASVTVDNPLCGDRVTLDITRVGDRVAAVGHDVKGCLLCEAAAATIAEFARGKGSEELKAMSAAVTDLMKKGVQPPAAFACLQVFAPVHSAKSRRDCVLLPFEALGKALSAAF